MSPARWEQIEKLLSAAVECDPHSRGAFLEAACEGDDALRAEVESLLACDDSGLLSTAAPELARMAADFICGESLAPGEQLGCYRIVRSLGAGGMGEVYCATDTRLERNVAIKLLPRRYAHDPEALERFWREARLVSALNHPNICALHDIGDHEGQPYLVLELIEGESLKHRIARGPLGPSEAVRLCARIADALQAAHSKGIIHRDIKPANIVLTPEGEPKVLDFGIGKLLSHPDAEAAGSLAGTGDATISARGLTPGTVAYMSPEQLKGEPANQRTDLFSLGVTLYQIVTGALPFSGVSIHEIQDAILTREPEPPRKWNPAVPSRLERVILRALEKDPAKRYQTAADMRDDLLRPRKALRWWIAAGVLATALTVVGALFLPDRVRPAPRTRPLTAFPGVEQFPTFSPDGRHVAFAWDDGGQPDVYRLAVAGGPPERLTSDAANECHPSWSPDGRSIAMFHCSPGTDGGMRQTYTEVHVLDLQAGGKRRVTTVYSPLNPGYARLAWTRDSRRLIVEDRTSIFEPFRLFLVSLETLAKTPITIAPPGSWGDRSPAISADGRTLAFVRATAYGISYIYTAELGSDGLPRSEPHRLTRNPLEITDLVWAGRKDELLCTADEKGVRSLMRVSAGNGAVRPISSLAPPGAHLALSPQGDVLAYTDGQTDDDIWRVDLQDPADVTGSPLVWSTRPDQSPQISADGEWIAFDSERSGSSEIWLARSDGAGLRQLTSLRLQCGTPRWSPDGKELAFDCQEGDNYDIYVANVAGSEPRRLTTHSANDAVPSWSRDGTWVYFSSNRGGSQQVWKAPARGGDPVPVTRGGGFGGFESLDGSTFYYAKTPARPTALWSVPVQGGAETEVFTGLKSWANYTITARGIYFRPEEPAPVGFYLRFFDFESRRIATVKEVRMRPGSGFAVSPAGDWMLFAAKTFRGGDIIVVENLP